MHKLLNDSPGKKIMLLGNEAIARGAIEAGCAFATTYPGTPSSEISLNLFQMSQESDLILNTAPMKKWLWKWLQQLPTQDFVHSV